MKDLICQIKHSPLHYLFFILTTFMFLCMNMGVIMYSSTYHIIGVLSLCLIAIFVFLKYKKYPSSIILSDKSYKICVSAIFVIVFLLQFYICYNVPLGYYSDFVIAREQAKFMVEDFSIKPVFSDYFHSYPYNIDTVLVLSGLYKLTGNYHAVELITSSLSNIAAIITGLTVLNITNNRISSVISIIFTEIFLLFCLKTYLPYSSNLVILFPILVIYIYTSNINKVWKVVLMTLCVAIGYRIKLTALIPYIGIIMIEGFQILKNKDFKIILSFITSIVVFFSLFSCIRNVALEQLNFKQDDTIEHDFVYYIALGQNNEMGGQFNKKIAVLGDVHMPKEQRDTLFRNIAIQSIRERTIVQHIKFFMGKIAFCWGEVKQDHLFTNHFDGFILILRHFVWYFSLLIMTLGAYFINDKRYKSFLLGIAGVVGYLYLSEAGARYVIMYSPIIFVMMGWMLSMKTKDTK